jgi:hypothetical protein
MSWLPRVVEATRERVSREFDNLGPDACLAEIAEALRQHNPEILDMAQKCARDVGNDDQVMVGFAMFYRLLVAQLPKASAQAHGEVLPRVTPATRSRVASRIAEQGAEAFTRNTIEHLTQHNPELLAMAHQFASRHPDYLGTMQGFALVYAALVAQANTDRSSAH